MRRLSRLCMHMGLMLILGIITCMPLARPLIVYATPVNEVEPNDTRATAQALASIGRNSPLNAQIDTPGDEDYISFTAVAGQSYTIEVFNAAGVLGASGTACYGYTRSGLGMYLSDPSGNQLPGASGRSCDATDIGGGNTHNLLTFTAGVSGAFTVRILANNTTVTGFYSLRVLPRYGQPGAAWDTTTLEPNNSWANAYELEAGYTNAITSEIEARNADYATHRPDSDWYRFNAVSGRTYVIELFNVAGSLGGSGTFCNGYTRSGVGLLVYDPQRTLVTQACKPDSLTSSAGNTHHLITISPTTTGVFYIQVQPNNGNVSGSYSIRLLPQHDENGAAWDTTTFEPNNTTSNAYAITPGYTNALTSEIEVRDSDYATYQPDADWYRFEAVSGRTYAIELFNVAGSLGGSGAFCDGYTRYGLSLRIYNLQGSVVAGECQTYDLDVSAGNIHHYTEMTAATSGTYYIQVKPNDGTASGSYSLRVLPKYGEPDVDWDAGSFEPNNSIWNSYSLSVGAEHAVSSQIEARGSNFSTYYAEQDWYRFEAVASQSYVIELFDVATALGSSGTSCDGYTRSGTGILVYRPAGTYLAGTCRVDGPTGVGVHHRVEFTAEQAGSYHIKVRPNGANVAGNYRLRVCADVCRELPTPTPTTPAPSPTATSTAVPPGFRVVSVNPAEGAGNQTTRITIQGSGFATSPAPTVRLSGSQGRFDLTNVTTVSAASFAATVPANLSAGNYDLIVTNPNGRVGTLPNAFTVLSGDPVITQVLPNSGLNDRDNDLVIAGLNFAAGAEVTLGTTALATSRVNGTALLAVVPAGLSPDSYDLTVTNPGGGQAQLAAAYTVLNEESSNDLTGSSDELWLDPEVPRAGSSAQVGIFVHRQGGTAALENVTVEFRRDSRDGELLGRGTVPFLDPVTGVESSTPIEVTFPNAGTVEIHAVIDPDNTVTESNEDNNVVSRTVVVAPAADDRTVPVVQSIATNGAAGATVSEPEVTVDISAADPPPDATGMQAVNVIEYVYNTSVEQWIPVKQSGWLPYDQTPARTQWKLLPLPGMHYLQVRARDKADNISIGNARQLVNYAPAKDTIGRRQTRVYRYNVPDGQSLTVNLEVLSGDADLYVWSSRTDQSARVSNLEDSANEQVSVPADQVAPGVYQVEVYGYTAAEYRITTNVGPVQAALQAELTVGGVSSVKPTPDAPVVPVDSLPDERQGAAPALAPEDNGTIYLPLVVR